MAHPVDRSQQTILLVEDEPFVRKALRLSLIRFGYTVLEAADGLIALAVAGEHSGAIDLLLTDIVMPGITGVELARRLGETRSGIKVLFMSGYTTEGVEQRGLMAGDTRPFIQKPFTPDVVVRQIREILGHDYRDLRRSTHGRLRDRSARANSHSAGRSDTHRTPE